MDPKLERMVNDFNEMKRQWETIWPVLRELNRTVDELKRELGIQRGRLMSEQIDALEQNMLRGQDNINHIMRETEHTRRLLEFNDVNVKEIMKALALIYRNVDELEEQLVPDSQT